MLIQDELQCSPIATMGDVTVAYLFRNVRGGCKKYGSVGNPSFYERFNLYFNNYGPSLSRGERSLRRIWVNAMWDVRRRAGCTAWLKSKDARRGAGRKARGGARRKAPRRSRDTRCGTERGRGAGRRGCETRGVALWRIRDEGLKEERDVRRCPPTFHSWARSRRGEDSRGGARSRYTVGHPLDRIGVYGRRCLPTFHSWAHSRREKRGQGKRCKREERKYPLTFHSWIPSSHQGSRRGGLSPGRD
jgi:hypothetical protein